MACAASAAASVAALCAMLSWLCAVAVVATPSVVSVERDAFAELSAEVTPASVDAPEVLYPLNEPASDCTVPDAVCTVVLFDCTSATAASMALLAGIAKAASAKEPLPVKTAFAVDAVV